MSICRRDPVMNRRQAKIRCFIFLTSNRVLDRKLSPDVLLPPASTFLICLVVGRPIVDGQPFAGDPMAGPLEFTDYALVWWDQMQKERVRNGERPITTWEEMRAIMRRRFVPSYYRRELHNHLQRLTQGSKSVDEYYKEMEIAMIRTNIIEDNEATMARFLHGLNRDIADVVEMHHYVELEEMVHQAIKVEQQLKRRGHLRRTSNSSAFGPWKNNPKKDTPTTSKFKQADPKHDDKIAAKKVQPEPNSSRNHDIKCFKCQGKGHIASECPNRRTMIFNNHGELETEEEITDKEESSKEDGDGEYAEEGELLVTRRTLSAQM
ncbi:UNVERIFIED_CONTAM: hypothetical protein Sindi_0083000 [Sesamum indicum]